MKAHVLKAQVKELVTYLKENEELDQGKLIIVMKKISKMEDEALEYMSSLQTVN